ncbi:hypothetical protein ACOMHN_009683 [Nucella lapillus]
MSGMIIDKVKNRITALEQAIQRLDFVKRHLNQNSSEIKTQIHTSISRHLETLRNREVWLLDQVDQVLVGKEEVLQLQQARLNKALGILHSSLTHASSTASTTEDALATPHLLHALEELNTTELKAEETPYIAFRADHLALRESILSYGRVDANGMPLLSAFADEDKPSASLPRHVEEYEDSEHHLFYKALQEGKANSANICVAMPKLSSRVEDWLQRPILQLTTAAEAKSPASEMVGTPMSQTTCAIQNWLSEIKHNPDVEDDDDFEIVDHSGSSQRESPVEEEERGLVLVEEGEMVDMFSHIPQDHRQWLLREGPSRASPPAQEDLRAFFQHIPRDTNMWLVTAQKQLESLEELKRGGMFCHIPRETATWLKRAHDKRAGSLQAAVPDMFAHISRDKNVWLKKEPAGPAAAEEAEAAEEKNHQKVESGGRGSYSSVSAPAPLPFIPNLMKEYLAGAPSTTECWLLPREGQASGAVSGLEESEPQLSSLPGIQKYLSSSIKSSVWLASAGEREVVEAQPSAQFFSHISCNQSDWLLSDQHRSCNTNPAQAIDLQKAAKKSISQWLRSGSPLSTDKSTTTTTHASPLDSLLHSFKGLSTSDWLMGRPRGESEGSESTMSWRILPDSPQSSTMSGLHIPPLNLASWVFQQNSQ